MKARTMFTVIVAATLATSALADNVIGTMPNLLAPASAPKAGDWYYMTLDSGYTKTTIKDVFGDNSYTTTIEVFPKNSGKVNGKTWTDYAQVQLVDCNDYTYTVFGGVYHNNTERVYTFDNTAGKTFKVRSSLADNTDASVRIRSFCNAVNN